MSETKHTPGPWKLGRYVSRGEPARVIESETGVKVATATCDNADLIAVAPEMEEALEVLVDIVPDLDAVRAEKDPREVSALNLELVRAVNVARAALKKAREG